jgi:hypothetical protein
VVVEATADAIIAALAERGVTPDRGAAMHYRPPQPLAVGDDTAKYRVLYRA